VDLSVVLPTLHRPGTALLIARRLAELLDSALTFELIVVTPRPVENVTDARVRCLIDRGRGVYAAYGQGIRAAVGEYVWLLGDDDFPLDAIRSLTALIRERRADLIAAPVIYSTGGLYRPTRSRFVLLFYNWCQQGVLYRRHVLLRHAFHARFKVQADHYVNVLLRGDRSLRTEFLRDPLCVFGAHGVSSRGGDRSFRKVRPYLAHRTLRPMGYLMFLLIVAVADIRKQLRRSAQ